MKQILLMLITLYKIFISPIKRQILGANCRFSLSCSEYASQKINEEGMIVGSLKAIKRILRCQPFTKIYEYS